MSDVNQIMHSFANLNQNDRQTTIRALSTMMRGRKQGQPPKKKVNGFIGYRSYYSALFSQLQQKQRSPFMTTLWKQDPFHGEWDLMCGTYSAIRPLLAEQKISFQMWIAYAVGPLGIVARDRYMATMGWTLVQDENGSYKLERTGEATVERAGKLMSDLNLLMQCLKKGLPVANPRQMIKTLSNRSGEVMHIKTSTEAAGASTSKTNDPVLTLARHNPTLAMSRLFEIPVDHAWIANGVQVRHISSFHELDCPHDATAVSQGPIDQAINPGWAAQQNAQHHTEGGTQSNGLGDFYNTGMAGQENNGFSEQLAMGQGEGSFLNELYSA